MKSFIVTSDFLRNSSFVVLLVSNGVRPVMFFLFVSWVMGSVLLTMFEELEVGLVIVVLSEVVVSLLGGYVS